MRQASPVVMNRCAGSGRCVDSVSANDSKSVFRARIAGSGSDAACAKRYGVLRVRVSIWIIPRRMSRWRVSSAVVASDWIETRRIS